MWKFLLEPRTSLRLDLASTAVWFCVLAAVELLWLHDVDASGLAKLFALFIGVTLIKHVYWHYRPPKVPPVTRYTNPRYTHTLDK